jgi:hypothetical protein
MTAALKNFKGRVKKDIYFAPNTCPVMMILWTTLTKSPCEVNR